MARPPTRPLLTAEPCICRVSAAHLLRTASILIIGISTRSGKPISKGPPNPTFDSQAPECRPIRPAPSRVIPHERQISRRIQAIYHP